MLIIYALFWFLVALLLALVEIEIEGKFGWAEKAPTWYRKKGFFNRIWGTFLGEKPLTGYHLFMNLFVFLMFHTGFLFGLTWSLQKELTVLSVYFIWAPTWDFLWFVFNPNYGIKNFKKEKIWWHSKSHWIFGLFPIDYLYAFIFSFIISGFSSYYYKSNLLINNIILVIFFLLFTFIAIIVSPLYQKWYKNMRKKDDRKISDIFHK